MMTKNLKFLALMLLIVSPFQTTKTISFEKKVGKVFSKDGGKASTWTAFSGSGSSSQMKNREKKIKTLTTDLATQVAANQQQAYIDLWNILGKEDGSELAQISIGQFSRIPVAAIPFLPADKINNFTQVQIQALSLDQLKALTQNQAAAITAKLTQLQKSVLGI